MGPALAESPRLNPDIGRPLVGDAIDSSLEQTSVDASTNLTSGTLVKNSKDSGGGNVWSFLFFATESVYFVLEG